MSAAPVTAPAELTTPLVDVRDLVVRYRTRRGLVTAVDGVDLRIDRGTTVGLVGESGSGKSTIGAVLLGLVDADQGTVTFDGAPMQRRRRADRVALAGRIQVIFQDPFGSMNPTRTVGEALTEQLRFGEKLPQEVIDARVEQALVDVSMATEGQAAAVLRRYPGQFSGGQLQRLAIARALVVEPEFIVCDEAVSALDLSVQAQVVNLLDRLSRDRGIAYLFISHDLSVVEHLSQEIVVLFAGQVMERGPAERVAATPQHPYTRALVLAAPVPDPVVQQRRRAKRRALRGAALDVRVVDEAVTAAPRGCPFAARCPYVIDRCRSERPALIDRGGVHVACHRYGELDGSSSTGSSPRSGGSA